LICHAVNEYEALKEALAKAIEVIEWCGKNDRSKPYEYGEARPDGEMPGGGKCFNTPREFASWWPNRLRDVLDGGKLRV
jgi:hypothetical protein